MGLGNSANSQNMDFERSALRAKSTEFQRKMNDFGGLWGWETARAWRKWVENGRQFGEQNVRNSIGKSRISMASGAGEQRDFVKSGSRVCLSMKNKI